MESVGVGTDTAIERKRERGSSVKKVINPIYGNYFFDLDYEHDLI